ncbi:MAG TPA: DUF1326 domain-containing protein [Xanthobacteraceae bacterium]|nr:DUF1326 domain-containing protein [Xanthobacteraceae bacterium]
MVSGAWSLRGELALSCSCAVFCPCTLSLGLAPPTEGYCQTWAGIRIDEGRHDDTDLAGVKVGLIIEIPGLMSRGNWTAGLFVDDKASIQAVKALTRIFTGRAGGSTHLLSILVSHFLGVQQAPIVYRVEGQTRVFSVDKIIDGAVTPIAGKKKDEPVVIRNSEYWVAPDITVARADKSRVRAFGRNWNFAGRSAEICRLDWGN